MSPRSRRHQARREALRLRCARQREELAESLTAVQQHLQPIDRALTAVRALRRTHLLFGALATLGAAAGMLFAGRSQRRRSTAEAARGLVAPAARAASGAPGQRDAWSPPSLTHST